MPKTSDPVIHSDPEILDGTPVFVGTRVPAQSLFDYLEAGDALATFLEDFPSVAREQAAAAIELARDRFWPLRVLLDESLPRGLARLLSDHEVVTVPEAGWAGLQR